MSNTFTGWDIGGAHLKVANINLEGKVLQAEQYAMPIWQGLDRLNAVLEKVERDFNLNGTKHGLTMTAELSDIFPNREIGVKKIVQQFGNYFSERIIRVYAGEKGMLTPDSISNNIDTIASANWMATAEYIAAHYKNGFLIDIGSTTTDIIPFLEGKPCPQGYSDYERLQSGELVYTGIVRTPVMTIAKNIMFHGKSHPVIAEVFATMADVYRLTGELKEHHDLMETADGKGKTPYESARRLARMLGLDCCNTEELSSWKFLATEFATQQYTLIKEALFGVMNKPDSAENTLLVGAGSGRFLAKKIAKELNCKYIDFDTHLHMDDFLRDKVTDCATAVSVAQLSRATL